MRAEDQPSRTPPGVAALMLRAHGIGTAAGAIVDAIYADNRVAGVRRVLGLCGLAKNHGALAVERAAQVALDPGAHTYRAVKACLDHHQATPLALSQHVRMTRARNARSRFVRTRWSGAPARLARPA